MTDSGQDEHEEQISHIKALFNEADIEKITRQINPKHRIKSEYIFLDTSKKNIEGSTTQTLKWDISVNKELWNSRSVPTHPIKNIIGMRLSTLRVGYFTRGIIPLTAVNFQLSVEEFRQQSIMMNNIQEYPIAYHFSLYKMQKTLRAGTNQGTYSVAGPYLGYDIFDLPASVDLVCNNNGYFWFSSPVREMPTTLSLTMYREYNKTIFPVVGNVVKLATQGATTTFLVVGWASENGVAVGQTAVLTGYTITSPNAVDLQMIDYINRREGFTILTLTDGYYVGAGTTLVKATTVVLDLDTTSMSTTDDSNGLIQNTTMLFPDVSVIIPLELIYLDEEELN